MPETNIKELKEKALTIIEKVKGTFPKIEDNETFEKANKALVYIANRLAEIGVHLDPIIDKANKTHKEALALKKEMREPWLEAKLYLNPMVARYLRELAEKKKEAEAKIAFGDETAESKALLESPEPEMMGTYVIPGYKYRIVDEGLVPYPEYWIIDEKKLGKMARDSKGKAKVPGVLFYIEDSTRTRKQ